MDPYILYEHAIRSGLSRLCST